MIVIGITGHQEIPDAALDFIEQNLKSALRPFAANFVGISSLAAGADQMFAKCVLLAGAPLRVVLPCERYEDTFADESDRLRFTSLLRGASEIETLAYDEPSEAAYLEAGKRIADLAAMVIAIWDGEEAKGTGGTGDIVRYARQHRKKVIVIWPEGLRRAQR
jgi:hypothetical protein